MRIRFTASALLAGLVLAGCTGSPADGIGPTNPQSGNNAPPAPPAGVGPFRAVWEFTPGPTPTSPPAFFAGPFPTDLYFSGTTDGTLNLPAAIAVTTPHHAALNAQDGYSTVAPASARFSAPINPASISGATVRMIEVNVDNATKATIGVRRLLVYGTDYTARVQPTVDSGGGVGAVCILLPAVVQIRTRWNPAGVRPQAAKRPDQPRRAAVSSRLRHPGGIVEPRIGRTNQRLPK